MVHVVNGTQVHRLQRPLGMDLQPLREHFGKQAKALSV